MIIKSNCSITNRKISVLAFVTGLFSASVQVIYLRELFSIFTGSEVIFSYSICCWMAWTAIGCKISFFDKLLTKNLHTIILLHLLFFWAGVLLIRAFPRVVQPGEQFSPLFSILIICISVSPVGLLSGLLFRYCTCTNNGKNVYRWDNTGNFIGFSLITLCILLAMPHRLSIVAISLLYMLLLINHWWKLGVAILVLLSFFFLDPVSARWKYNSGITAIEYGRSGEIGKGIDGSTVWLNSTVYKTAISNAHIEQAVHVPLSIRYPGNVLLVHDNGHLKEIRKYTSATYQCVEFEPLLADSICVCTSPERLPEKVKYDAILLGCDVPQNISDGRMFTDHFFNRMKVRLDTNGILSFSFNINMEYLDNNTKQIIDITKATLKSCFNYVKLFPGDGVTFLSSDQPFNLPDTSFVPTLYYNDYILAGISSARMNQFNLQDSVQAAINTVGRPIMLMNSINRYFELFKIPPVFVFLFAVVILFVLGISFWRTTNTVSIGTTGFSCGLYSITLMMLYQSYFGTLYSSVSLFMIFLSAGFTAGSFIKSNFFKDSTIVVYVVFSLVLFSFFPGLPEAIWFVAIFLMGMIAAAQLVNIEDTPAPLNAADIAGGVAGILLGGVYILPNFGITGAMGSVLIVKMLTVLYLWRVRKIGKLRN